jgi:hypothetical protein
VSSAGQERARIQLVLDQYEAAYSRTDEAALRRIDPNFKSIPNRGLLRSVKLTLSPRDIVVDDDLQSATVTATTNFVYEWNRAGLDRTSSGVLRWKLRKSGSEWTVVR